ncbi:MAG: helix-turn-helix domain-containing protein [Firmicutes bacterium]|nr:helix-turn-helix domain-containing protein [Bacillota bacterium]
MEILTVGEKIKRLRNKKGLSLSKLGGEYASKAHLSYIENNKASPNIELLKYIAEKLEVELEYLLETELEQAKGIIKLLIKEMEVEVRLEKIKEIQKKYSQISKLAKKYNLKESLGKTNYLTAKYYIKVKKYREALEYLEKSIYNWLKVDNNEGIIKVYIKEGNIYINQGLYEIALQKYRQAYFQYESLDYKNLKLESDILFNLSTCHHRMSENEKAINYAEKVCDIDRKLEDSSRYSESLVKQASIFIEGGNYIKAEELLDTANEMLKRKKNRKTLELKHILKTI